MDDLEKGLAEIWNNHKMKLATGGLVLLLGLIGVGAYRANNTLNEVDNTVRQVNQLGGDVQGITSGINDIVSDVQGVTSGINGIVRDAHNISSGVRNAVNTFVRDTDGIAKEVNGMIDKNGASVDQVIQLVSGIREVRQQRLENGTAIFNGKRMQERKERRQE